MQLYFVRHASAASKTTWPDDDGLRPLTGAGKNRFRQAAQALVEAGVIAPDLILTSPLVRARQTADILTKALPGAVPIVEDDRLADDFNVDALTALLAENPEVASLAIVGHNPDFATVLSAVIGGANVNVRKGAVALVEIDDPAEPIGRLMWLATPELFRPCP